MNIQRVKYAKPQFGEAHGLFGTRHLKRHNQRDNSWTANDLIEQYEKINAIFAKDNAAKKIQHELEQMKQAEMYKRLKKEKRDKLDELQKILKGDVQRTKNILINFPNYMKMYQNKQSFEVLEELDFKTFQMRKSHDRYMIQRQKLIKEYEKRLLDVAQKQEMIRYYDIKEFQQERDVKQILVKLKSSETRRRAIERTNMTYKFIIDQLLKDALFYEPVLEALNQDWNEQTRLVQQTYNIGFPAIEHVKHMKKEVSTLRHAIRSEEQIRYEEILLTKQVLKEHPKMVKQFIRRDSDFELLGDRYVRETASMTELKEKVETIENDITLLKNVTLSRYDEDITKRAQQMTRLVDMNRSVIDIAEKGLKENTDQLELIDFVRYLLLNDNPEIYKEELLAELIKMEQKIEAERKTQQEKLDALKRCESVIGSIRFAMQHILDVLRHVGTEEYYIDHDYPNELLKLPLLRFNPNLPEQPKILQWDLESLLDIATTKVNILMEEYDKAKGTDERDELFETTKAYQQAFVEDFQASYRPPSPSLGFD